MKTFKTNKITERNKEVKLNKEKITHTQDIVMGSKMRRRAICERQNYMKSTT